MEAKIYSLDDYRRPSPESVRMYLTGQETATAEDVAPGSSIAAEIPGEYADQIRAAAAESGMTATEFLAQLYVRGLATSALERQGYTTTSVKDTRSIAFKPIHSLKNNQ